MAGVKANRRRTGCDLNRRIDKVFQDLFGDGAGTVGVTTANKAARYLGEKSNVGKVALVRCGLQHDSPARRSVEQINLLAQGFGESRISVFGVNSKVGKCHD
ncbi:hypothetical protein PSV3_00210 [Septimatrevirus PSV33]|uniref:Uncharacterized protein n=2 Tax=Pseudomonas phage PSV3 TaxID=3003632 RepID=A0AAE9VW58_9CAUD|nr:hypothetical protein PM406_gp11 [Pseudomonas phage PSV3]YP_010598030.1 hypothetical protein PM407_gp09 [Pseudomonas phage PSV3]WBF76912.1 hypothetical protein PSV3_00210 [Pseudomonas phage PSV3]WBF76989.1 hypothetical protein PSV3_00288 [Pseudomonas phage PSV3]